MKILSPLTDTEEVKPLVEAGADEFYCGLLTKEWDKNYTRVGSQNKRYWETNHFRSLDELKKAIEIVHSFGKQVFLTVNAQFYTKSQYPYLIEELKAAKKAGIDAFIIADLALLMKLKYLNINTDFHISSIASVFNSGSAEFYNNLGASRIMLPRQITMKDIGYISKAGMNTEAFVLNERCWNIDGLCTFNHGIESKDGEKHDGCSLPYQLTIINNNPSKLNIMRNNRRIRKQILLKSNSICHNECGICALYHFEKHNVYSVKIVGRGHPLKMKIKYIKYVKEAMALLNESRSFLDFQKKAQKLYKLYFNYSCNDINCYYSELI